MLVFTDGGCYNNGKINAKASYAVYIDNCIIRGHVMPHEYKCIEETIGDKKIYILECDKETKVMPSNNRGELLSLIYAFIEILKKEETTFIVYSDSQICVKTINEWYESRLRKGTVSAFKNLDLVEILMNLYYTIKACKSINIVHIRGHQKIIPNMSEEQKKILGGNDIVDKYASDTLKIKELFTYELIKIQ